MSVARTIARNTAFNGLGRAWEAVVGLVLVAYIVSRVGASGYGLWAVVGAFTGYAALFDLGIGSAYAKYIAEHAARDERDRISGIVSTGVFFYVVFGGIFIALMWPVVDVIFALVQGMGDGAAGEPGDASGNPLDVPVLNELHYLIRWGLVLFVASNILAPFSAVQTGLQRMGITNAIGAGVSIVKIVATIAFLELGFGVRGLLYVNAMVLAAFGVASVVTAFRICPGLRVSLSQVSWTTFRTLFTFGWRTQVSRLSNLIMFETDVLVIAIVLRDLELTGFYRIGVELANKMRQVPTILLSALVPASSELAAKEDGERLRRLYLTSSKYVAAVSVPMAFFTVGAAGPLMQAWQGSAMDLTVSAMVLRILALGYLANIMAGPGVNVALGTGRPGLPMKAGLIATVSNITLTLGLVFSVGFWGIPIATGISMWISGAWFAGAFGRVIAVGLGEVIRRAVVWPVVAGLPGLAFGFLAAWGAGDIPGRWASLGMLVGATLATLITFFLIIRHTRFLDERDLDFFDGTLGLGRIPGYARWVRPMREGYRV
ncbi:MAG: polysaccharide biosynthesis protein [Candidatus Hydrogenedentes bacterium]|nr:polysaccharide biosynthesis protein [Candidatus Hydrogenedentota bacterium]